MIRKISIMTFGAVAALAFIQTEASARPLSDNFETQTVTSIAARAYVDARAQASEKTDAFRVAINPQPLPPHGEDPE